MATTTLATPPPAWPTDFITEVHGLVASVAGLDPYISPTNQSAPPAILVAQFTDCTRTLLRLYRTKVKRTWKDVSDQWRLPAIRAFAAADTIAKVVAAELNDRWGFPSPWDPGLHCAEINDRDLQYRSFKSFSNSFLPFTQGVQLGRQARRRLFTDQSQDLISAIGRIVNLTSTLKARIQSKEIETSLNLTNYHIGLGPLGIDFVGEIESNCKDATWVARHLFGRSEPSDLKRVERMALDLDLVSVTGWESATRLYPLFQFKSGSKILPGQINPHVHAVLAALPRRTGDHPFHGWPLAIWLYINVVKEPRSSGFWPSALQPIGLWAIDNFTPDRFNHQNIFHALNEDELVGQKLECGTYYRVGSREFEEYPYFYSRYNEAHPGRYDPVGSYNYGTLYLGMESRGCWAEVMDRQPVVTLTYLASRCISAIELSGTGPVVIDLTGQHGRLISSNRDESQLIAKAVLDERNKGLGLELAGIKYSLRAQPSQTGIALFGKRRFGEEFLDPDKAPDKRGIAGTWTVKETKYWYDSPELFEYLGQTRSGRSPAFPVLLRRLPMDWPKQTRTPRTSSP